MSTTPAPWFLRRFGPSRGGGLYVVDATPDDEHGRCIANIIAAPNTNPDWEANAQLIAAAPDLLAVCEAYYYGRTSDRECVAMMRDAIVKAKGNA